ncbi:MAG: E3 ubiquitin ligase family protein [Cyanobacteria bacterium J06614_10]
MAFIGGLLFIVSIFLFFFRRSQLARLACIRMARPCTTEQIRQTAEGVAEEIGGGSWQDYVKVQGEIQCDQPLRSQLKKVDCVYYTSKVIRKYEETSYKKDNGGNRVKETEQKSETISNDTQSTPFWLVDATGKIKVQPDDANDIETIEVLSEFQRESSSSGGKISFGKFSISLPRQASHGPGRTIGYQYEESILPIGRDALVIGMATDATARLTLRKPTEGKNKFIISLKAEAELAKAATSKAKQAFYGMLATSGVGTVLIAVSLFQ